MNMNKKILLVDDDRLVLSMIAGGLISAGYCVFSAESTEEAEAWLAAGDRPYLAILDVNMAGKNGLYLAQRLQQLDCIPFIMLTAYSDPSFVAQATLHGALGYALKPMDISQLIPVIETALARSMELAELRKVSAQLQSALDAERSISVATGITMAEYKLKRSDAFSVLRNAARRRHRKLSDMADVVVEAHEALTFEGARASVAKFPSSLDLL